MSPYMGGSSAAPRRLSLGRYAAGVGPRAGGGGGGSSGGCGNCVAVLPSASCPPAPAVCRRHAFQVLTHLQPLALRRLSQNRVLRGAAQSGKALLHKGGGASQAEGARA
jgi:hypothetical protein